MTKLWCTAGEGVGVQTHTALVYLKGPYTNVLLIIFREK